MTSSGLTHQTDSGPDLPSRQDAVRARVADSRERLLVWAKPAAVILALTLLVAGTGIDASGQVPLAIRWLLLAVLVAAAWSCSASFTLTTSLIAILTWSWLEIPSSTWIDWFPGHLIRLAVVMGTVAGLIRLRKQLAEAERLARVDSLTALPNRQALIEALQAELSRAKRFGRSFSLAMLDCDGFKQINDSRGHMAGDEVLRQIGTALRQQMRPFDCAGRWGGDEFMVVLSEVDKEDAQVIAERLRAAMRHHVERDHPTLTFSLGVVTFRHADLDGQEAVKLADAAMYKAKRLGRDQTRFEVVPPE